MFESARLKLTAWYLVIIMAISLLFSLVIYNGVNREFIRFERMRQRREFFFSVPVPPPVDSEIVTQARTRVIFTLSVINLTIFVMAGSAGYFLAGRTLSPIQEMVDE